MPMIDLLSKIPQSNGMKIKQFWKLKMMETLSTIYGDTGLDIDKVSIYLDEIISKSHNPVAKIRNIYEETEWEMPIDDTLQMVNDNRLIIGANGTFTFRQDVRMSELSEITLTWLAQRKQLKGIALTCEEKNDVAGARKYDNYQGAKKEYINSAYGASVLRGYILYSPDSASMITSQSREFISEMMWTLEKFLGSNMVFTNKNEFYSYVNEVTRFELDRNMIFKYNIKVPTDKMIKRRLRELIECIPRHERGDIDTTKSLFLMTKNIAKDPMRAINFYYKCNLYAFIKHNPTVMNIINWIMEQGKSFMSPYLKDMKKGESCVYIEPISELTEVFSHFVLSQTSTYDRVNKYKSRGRHIIPISDTDSVIVRLDSWVNFLNDNGTVKFDTFTDEPAVFRAVNTMSVILTDICNFMARNMARNCYVPVEYHSRLNLKNEFFFKRILIYSNVMKNYSVWKRLREGVLVNRIDNTGLKLTGSNINKYVSLCSDGILKQEIHYAKNISITNIMKRVYDLEAHIRNEIYNKQSVSFGTFVSYKSSNNIVNPMSDNVARAVEIWNWLYPDNKIEEYSKVYLFNTLVMNESQLDLIKDLNMREYVRQVVFTKPKDPNVRKYGLRTIAVPDNMDNYPYWMKDIINVNKIVEKHVNSITTLLPSIGVYISRMKSNRSHISPLINL